MANYFNSLSLREQLKQLGQCRFMQREEFSQGCDYLKGKKIGYSVSGFETALLDSMLKSVNLKQNN